MEEEKESSGHKMRVNMGPWLVNIILVEGLKRKRAWHYSQLEKKWGAECCFVSIAWTISYEYDHIIIVVVVVTFLI